MILALKATWAAAPHHKAQPMLPSAPPAMAPNNHEDEFLLIDGDKHYALHGAIMMVVLIVFFIAFVFCLAVVTRLRRPRPVEEETAAKNPCNCFELLCSSARRKKRNKGDEKAAPEAPLRGINEKPADSVP